jgi:hypothetical protein
VVVVQSKLLVEARQVISARSSLQLACYTLIRRVRTTETKALYFIISHIDTEACGLCMLWLEKLNDNSMRTHQERVTLVKTTKTGRTSPQRASSVSCTQPRRLCSAFCFRQDGRAYMPGGKCEQSVLTCVWFSAGCLRLCVSSTRC